MFDRSRPEKEQGNGLFTYALLKALTDPKADLPGGDRAYRNRIEISEVKRYLDGLFDLQEPSSIASNISSAKGMKDIQQPVYIPARLPGATRPINAISILRSLEPN